MLVLDPRDISTWNSPNYHVEPYVFPYVLLRFLTDILFATYRTYYKIELLKYTEISIQIPKKNAEPHELASWFCESGTHVHSHPSLILLTGRLARTLNVTYPQTH